MQTPENEAWSALVREQERRRYAALIPPDLTALEQLFDDRLVYTHSSGVVDTKASYLSAIADGQLFYHSASAEIQRLFCPFENRPDAVICISRITMEVSVAGVRKQMSNQGTALWVGHGDEFRLIAFQATPIVKG